MRYTVKELSQYLNVTRQLVNGHCLKGNLVRDDDGLLDSENALNRAWIEQRVKNPAHKPVGQSTHRTRILAPGDTTPSDDLIPEGDLTPDQLKNMSKADIDKLKSMESMLKTQVERQIKRKELISRKLVAEVFGEIYSIEAQALKTMGVKLASDLAGFCGCDDPAAVLKVEQRIDGEVAKALKHITVTIDKALERWEPK